MKNFLFKLRSGYSRFMAGRYGFDRLCLFLLVLYLLFSLTARFMPNIVLYLVFVTLSLAVFGCALFRFLSKNTHRRYLEGQKFDAVYKKVKAFFKLQKNRFRDRKTHVYVKCKNCKAVLRYPKVKGRHTSTCPRCGTLLEIRI